MELEDQGVSVMFVCHNSAYGGGNHVNQSPPFRT